MNEPGCPCCGGSFVRNEMSRRQFMNVTGTSALGAIALPPLSWALLAGDQKDGRKVPQRRPLIVKPILTYEVPVRQPQTSWRAWGGIQAEEDAAAEIKRITDELEELGGRADFPVKFLPVSGVRNKDQILALNDMDQSDLLIVYAAGGSQGLFDLLHGSGKDIIFFCRHESGPVYLWYEIISPRYLRQHTDRLAVKGIDENDVVIDSQEELLWRLRALCGLRNTVGSCILTVGGAGAWSQPLDRVLNSVKEKYKLEIRDISYEELGKLITDARDDKMVVTGAKRRATAYLSDPGIKLETERKYIENCFMLEEVLARLLEKFNCRAITINNCMGTIMPISETTACLTLSLLNDAGYLAYCESDFVVVPMGILLANISGKPSFLNDPTYPHDNVITLAHCTAPRKMDGKKAEPAQILTHFESDYGAAPKVEMLVGQMVTNVMPDFAYDRNIGLKGKIISNPVMEICRTQIDVSYECDSKKVAGKMPGFHWITVYGDYIRETGYALKKIGIAFEDLG